MTRHLAPSALQSTLSREASIEAFLGGSHRDGRPTIRWISVCSHAGRVVVRCFEAYDPRDPGFLDVYELTGVGELPDEPVEERAFSSLEEALAFVESHHGIGRDRFVNEGVVQDEYADYLARS